VNSLSPASSTSSSTVLWCCSQRPEWMPRRMTACSRLLSSAVAKPHRELDLVSLIYRMEPKTKKWKTEKLKSKKRICSEVSINSPRGIRGVTARIRPPHPAAAAIDHYLMPTGPTAANLQQQRVCSCGPVLGQTDRGTDGRTPYRFTNPTLHTTCANNFKQFWLVVFFAPVPQPGSNR